MSIQVNRVYDLTAVSGDPVDLIMTSSDVAAGGIGLVLTTANGAVKAHLSPTGNLSLSGWARDADEERLGP